MKVLDLFPLLGIGDEGGPNEDNCFFAKNAKSNDGARRATECFYLGKEKIFKTYQAEQGGRFDQMMSSRAFVFVFLEHENGYMLYRCYKKKRCIKISQAKKEGLIPADYEEEIGYKLTNNSHYYDYEEWPTPGELEERLIIDFNKSGQSYCVKSQKISEYDVVEILPKRPSTKHFNGYMNVYLTWKELKDVIEDANWKYHLKRQNAVYLILDKKSGKQYVGSSYNYEGLYGRWSKYAKYYTGGNKEFINIKKDKTKGVNYIKENFIYSILETFTLKQKREILQAESLWKRKLGSRAHGLNDN